MKQSKQILKRIIDLAMIVLLPLLMAEILTGQEIHEWLGTGMLVLFLAHHFLNLGWWKSFLKGKYTPSSTFGTALDLLLLLDMIALCVSGIMMSGFVFRFLHIIDSRQLGGNPMYGVSLLHGRMPETDPDFRYFCSGKSADWKWAGSAGERALRRHIGKTSCHRLHRL